MRNILKRKMSYVRQTIRCTTKDKVSDVQYILYI